MEFAFDLSALQPNRAKGPDGRVWSFPAMADRNTVQSVTYHQLAIGLVALTKATQENRPDIDDFVFNVGELSHRLIKLYLKDENGNPPSNQDAVDLATAGFVNHLMAHSVVERKAQFGELPDKDAEGKSEADEIDLDKVKEGFSHPTETPPSGDTTSG